MFSLLLLLSACKTGEEVYIPNPVYGSSVNGIPIEVTTIDGSTYLTIPSQLVFKQKLEQSEGDSYTFKEAGITLSGDLTGDAIYTQGAYKAELHFEKLSDDASLYYARPQEEKIKAYSEEEVMIELSDGSHLSGAITAKDNSRDREAVILINGSGSQDRYEAIGGHKPFYIIANTLAKEGFAVLSVDDKGVNKSSPLTGNETTFTLANDLLDEIASLKELGYAKISLIGHSEGGIIASIVANKADVKAIILMASPALSGEEIMLLQNKVSLESSGLQEAQIEFILALLRNMFDAVKIGDKESFKKSAMPIYNSEAMADLQWQTLTTPWTKTFISIDPALYLEKLTMPVLVLQGGKDTQVDPTLNVPKMKEALKESKSSYQIKLFDNLNHLFQSANTGLSDEYIKINETISDEVLKEIVNFLKDENETILCLIKYT